MSDTGCGRLISVLAFYVFSCSCCQSPQTSKPSREARNESQLLWREEIESGPIPSFVRNNNSGQSSKGSSRINSKGSRGISTSSSSQATSQFSRSVTPDTEPRPLDHLVSHVETQKIKRITTVTISELPKIHPPINDRHPPVVSVLPESRAATAWMRLPPPPARVMRAVNRAAHIHRASQRDGGAPWDIPLTGLEGRSMALRNSTNIATEETKSPERCGRSQICHRADAEVLSTCYSDVASKQTAVVRLRDEPFPTLSSNPDGEYEYRCFDPITGGTNSELRCDEEHPYRTPPPSTAPFVEIIRMPPPALKGPFSAQVMPGGFGDIYD